jgi:anti-sigma regulatory factor (Ser/Thr protein kinase)
MVPAQWSGLHPPDRGASEVNTETALLGSLTIPGKPDHLRTARAFVARTLGDHCACVQTAILLTSELVTNSLQHSWSRRPGGTITVTLIAIPGGIRAEVIDEGAATIPELRPTSLGQQELADGGRGLHLVNVLATRWNYARDKAGTVSWFELSDGTL